MAGMICLPPTVVMLPDNAAPFAGTKSEDMFAARAVYRMRRTGANACGLHN